MYAQLWLELMSCPRPSLIHQLRTPDSAERSSMALGLSCGQFTACQAPRCLLKVELGADVQRLVDQLCLLPLVNVTEAGGGGSAGGAAGVGHTAVRDGAALRPAARKVEGTGKSGDKEFCTWRSCTLTSPRSSLPVIVMMTLTLSCTSRPTSSLSNSHDHLHDTRRLPHSLAHNPAACPSIAAPRLLLLRDSLHARHQAWLHMEVGPHVHGLLLAPHELSVGVAPQLTAHQVEGEGCQLLQAHQGNLWGRGRGGEQGQRGAWCKRALANGAPELGLRISGHSSSSPPPHHTH